MWEVRLGNIKKLVCDHTLNKDWPYVLGQDLNPGPKIKIYYLLFTLICYIQMMKLCLREVT